MLHKIYQHQTHKTSVKYHFFEGTMNQIHFTISKQITKQDFMLEYIVKFHEKQWNANFIQLTRIAKQLKSFSMKIVFIMKQYLIYMFSKMMQLF